MPKHEIGWANVMMLVCRISPFGHSVAETYPIPGRPDEAQNVRIPFGKYNLRPRRPWVFSPRTQTILEPWHPFILEGVAVRKLN